MALRIVQGFETVRDDTDLRSQGWTPSPGVATTLKKTVAIPSITGTPGWSLRPTGAFQAMGTSSNVNLIWGASGDQTFGYRPTGFTVAQAWAAGGMTLGFGALFNSGVAASFGAGGVGGSSVNVNSYCFDGTLYWAYRQVGSAFTICTSRDLANWTPTSSQPFVPNANSTLSYVGGGVIVAMWNPTAAPNVLVWITTNLGASWTAVTLATNAANNNTMGAAAATGTSSAPHVVSALQPSSGSNVNVVSVGNLTTASMTTVLTGLSGNNLEARNLMRPYSNNGLLILASPDSGGQPVGFQPAIVTAKLGDPNIATAAAWSKAVLVGIGRDQYPSAIEYHPVSNLWVVSVVGTGTSAGIFTFPNTGAAGTPVAPAGNVTCTQRYSTVSMSAVFKPAGSNVLAAVGWQGHMITSADGGITWTESSPRLIPSGTAGVDWAAAMFDGTRYVVATDSTTGMLATTPDLQTNWAAAYAMENSEIAWTVGTGSTGTGLLTCTAPPSATTGQFSWNGSNNGANNALIQVGSPSGGTRAVALWGANPNSSIASTTVPVSTPYHYYEMVYKSVTTTQNLFTVSLFIDGTLVGSGNFQILPASDTTSSAVIALQRNGCWTAFDDIRVTIDNGQGMSGQAGAIVIFDEPPDTDVSTQWTKVGNASSNALSVRQPAFSSQATNSVTSANAGDRDVYSSAATAPAGFSVKAVLVEGYFTQQAGSASTVTVGLISGGNEVQSTQSTVNTSGASFVNVIVESDPNGNVPWTNAAATASQMSIHHIS